MRKWKVEDSIETYNIRGWGSNFFNINEKGNVSICIEEPGKEIDMMDILNELKSRDVSTPILIRFPDLLKNRISSISNCFDNAAHEYNYSGKNYSVYPIKVNQVKPVVDELMNQGSNYRIGLEAGSKPELHAVLAYASDPEILIICNGYKDEDFIELGLLAQKMGKRIFLVVEKLNELRLILDIGKRHGIKPNIGIRIKLSSPGSGKWEDSGGDQSKFGLSPSVLLDAVSILENHDMLDCLKLIHFHIGSQITKIRKIKNALREASQFYVQLSKMGCNIEFVDIGGGLGVDYDGSHSPLSSSMNYSIQEYANDSVFAIVDACEKNDLPHPHIISESGRALTAHHSVLVFDVLESTSLPVLPNDFQPDENEHELVIELYDIYDNLKPVGMLESWHDALQIREETLDLFSLGLLDLKTRADVERIFWPIAREIWEMADDMKHPPLELKSLSKMLADKYFCNFSVFQSLPDSWAIDQIFPIMPLHRLNERPNKYATIHDITCDSDGKIDRFIQQNQFSNSLRVHSLKPDEPYYIGVFLVGAYQEILGDLHNLFGDTNAVHIKIEGDTYKIDQIIDGETIAEVLKFVQYNDKQLVRTIESWVGNAVKEGKITSKEGKEFINTYRSGLYGSTYLV